MVRILQENGGVVCVVGNALHEDQCRIYGQADVALSMGMGYRQADVALSMGMGYRQADVVLSMGMGL